MLTVFKIMACSKVFAEEKGKFCWESELLVTELYTRSFCSIIWINNNSKFPQKSRVFVLALCTLFSELSDIMQSFYTPLNSTASERFPQKN